MVGAYLAKYLESQPSFTHHVLFVCGREPFDPAAGPVAAEAVVLLSSHLVYSPDAGEGVDESRPTFAWSDEGRAMARAEMAAEKWAAAKGIPLAIVRPALTFGRGVDGDMLRLFNRVIRGHYVHIRGNDAKVSLVTALDVARAMAALAGRTGIYNVSDGRAHTWLSLVEAMTANAGAPKRMTHLPEAWALWIRRVFSWLPIVRETLSAEALEPLSRTLVLDNSRVREATGIDFHDTVAVISRTDNTYPYEDD